MIAVGMLLYKLKEGNQRTLMTYVLATFTFAYLIEFFAQIRFLNSLDPLSNSYRGFDGYAEAFISFALSLGIAAAFGWAFKHYIDFGVSFLSGEISI
jgi:hypothetical protein